MIQAQTAWQLSIANILAAKPPPPPPERTCCVCKELKPLGEYYLINGKHAGPCKPCHIARVQRAKK